MAAFGVVFALAAGQAAAQVTVTVPKTVDEGERASLTVSVKVEIPAMHVSTPSTTVRVKATVTPDDGFPYADDASLTDGEPEDVDTPASVDIEVPDNMGDVAIKRTLTGRIRLQTRSDNDAEDEALQISFDVTDADDDPTTYKGHDGETVLADPDDAKITINDTDEQKFEWDLATDSPKEGGGIMVTLDADPQPVNLEYPTALSIATAGYTVTPTSVDFAASLDSVEITIDTPDSDGNREEDEIELRALVAGTAVDRLDPLKIDVADIHGLPAGDKITAKAFLADKDGDKTDDEAMSVVEGGGPVYVTVTVDRGKDGYPMGEELKLAVTSSQNQDYRIETPGNIASGDGKKSVDFKLWALEDADVGAEDLTLNLVVTGATAKNGSGESSNTFTIMIEDATKRSVVAKDEEDVETAIAEAMGDAPLNPGDSFMLMTEDLFEHDATAYDVSYGASVEGEAVSVTASGDAVTVTAESAGEATVTVTATAVPRSSSAVITQTVSNTVHIEFQVVVELAGLSVTLSGPDDPNISEGASAELTATANRPVEADTTVELILTGGTASPADYTAESITIAAGETTGTTMVMAVEDGTAEDMETLTLQGRINGLMTNEVTLNIWDAAVPALPVIAQLLLAAFLAVGGYRRYLRRR